MAFSATLACATVAIHALLTSSFQLKQSERTNQDPSEFSHPFDFAEDVREITEDVLSDEPMLLPTEPILSGDCGRGHDCGYEVETSTQPTMSVPCPGGEKWMSKQALLLRGRNGTSAIYCAVPKMGTTYMFNVMKALGMPYLPGARNSEYRKVNDIIASHDIDAIAELCNAAVSLVIVRNPWDRIASAYVDKVLTKEVFNEPPEFKDFMTSLAALEPTHVNEHFKPASEICHTTGTNKQEFNRVFRIEDGLSEKLHDMFVNELNFPEDEVARALGVGGHSSDQKQRNMDIDKSKDSDCDRTAYYFKQTDPDLARSFYADDIEFGNYTFELDNRPMGCVEEVA